MGWEGSTYQGPFQMIMIVGGAVAPGIVPGEVHFQTTDTTGASSDALVMFQDHAVDLPANPTWNIRSFGATFVNGGAALAAGATTYFTLPFACASIPAWNIQVSPADTATIDIWRVATGTAIPIAGNSITAAAVPAIAANTNVHSTVETGWCGTGTCAIAQNDVIGINLKAVGGTATFAAIQVQCNQINQ